MLEDNRTLGKKFFIKNVLFVFSGNSRNSVAVSFANSIFPFSTRRYPKPACVVKVNR